MGEIMLCTTHILSFLALALSLALAAPEGNAHPVIYKGGLVYWGQFSSNSNVQKISYTFHPRFSIEANSEFYRGWQNYRDGKLGPNILLRRWIFENSQGNIYLSVHGGTYRQEDAHDGGIIHPQLAMDWESRKLYTALNFSSFHFTNGGKSVEKWSYRAGFAPYIVGMDALQTWMIFQFNYFKEVENKVKITPMMRFFYQNALWEVGSDLDGKFFLTLMVHH